MENKNDPKQMTTREKRILWLLILLILLNLLTFFFFMKNRQEVITHGEKNKTLMSDQLVLQRELESKKDELDKIKTNNVALQTQIDQQKDQIVVYINNLQKNEKDLKFLAEVRIKLKGYEKIIQELRERNEELVAENKNLTAQNSSLKEEGNTLRKENEDIQRKLALVSGLQAHDFSITALKSRKSGKYTTVTKAHRVNSIKTCFNISENILAEAGEKVLHLRIMDPKGQVLPNDEGLTDTTILSINGEKITFTGKRTIDYNQRALEACIFWNNNDKLLKGDYTFEVWLDGKMIGKGHHHLK